MRATTCPLVAHLTACLVASVTWCTAAVAQDDDAWAGYLVEVTYAYRQDPPRKLVEKRAEIEAALATATEGGDARERTRLEASLARIAAEIEKDTGHILLGWACRVNEDGLRVDGRTSMAAFFVPAGRANHETASALKPGDCIVVPKRGLKDVHATGGRRYRETRRIKAIERPSWYKAPVEMTPPLEVAAESAKHAEASMTFQLVQERESGQLYRFSLRTKVVNAPDGADDAVVRLAIHARDHRGVPLGPILVEAKPKRAASGFSQYRTWELITTERVKLDVDTVTVEVQAVAFADG